MKLDAAISKEKFEIKKNHRIEVASTGYVELSITALLSQYHKVTSVDIILEKVEMINNKKSPMQDKHIGRFLLKKELDPSAILDAEGAYWGGADFVVAAPISAYLKPSVEENGGADEGESI